MFLVMKLVMDDLKDMMESKNVTGFWTTLNKHSRCVDTPGVGLFPVSYFFWIWFGPDWADSYPQRAELRVCWLPLQLPGPISSLLSGSFTSYWSSEASQLK